MQCKIIDFLWIVSVDKFILEFYCIHYCIKRQNNRLQSKSNLSNIPDSITNLSPVYLIAALNTTALNCSFSSAINFLCAFSRLICSNILLDFSNLSFNMCSLFCTSSTRVRESSKSCKTSVSLSALFAKGVLLY